MRAGLSCKAAPNFRASPQSDFDYTLPRRLWKREITRIYWGLLSLAARPEIAYVLPFENRGTELGAGMFAMDALPEDNARELQEIRVKLEA